MRSSESDRALICPSSLILPRVSTPNAKRDEAARFGTAMHAWVETGKTDDDTVMRKAILIDRSEWWPTTGRHEVTFAIQLARGELYSYDEAVQRKIDPGVDRDSWKASWQGADWLTGTIDYLGVHRGRPWVDDLKTGRWPVEPRKSKQLLSYLLVPWLEEGGPLDAIYYRSITQWPRYPLGGLPERKGPYEVTGAQLAMHLEDLRYSVSTPEEANPTTDGCRFCECKAACTAYDNWLEQQLGA